MGMLDTLKKNLEEGSKKFKEAEWKSDYKRKVDVPGPKSREDKKAKDVADEPEDDMPPKDDKGNYIKPRPYKKGGMVKSSASRRADGCAQRGKTKGKIV